MHGRTRLRSRFSTSTPSRTACAGHRCNRCRYSRGMPARVTQSLCNRALPADATVAQHDSVARPPRCCCWPIHGCPPPLVSPATPFSSTTWSEMRDTTADRLHELGQPDVDCGGSFVFSCILEEKLSENLCYDDPKRRALCSFHAHSRCVGIEAPRRVPIYSSSQMRPTDQFSEQTLASRATASLPSRALTTKPIENGHPLNYTLYTMAPQTRLCFGSRDK